MGKRFANSAFVKWFAIVMGIGLFAMNWVGIVPLDSKLFND
jgi:hypothetical protein